MLCWVSPVLVKVSLSRPRLFVFVFRDRCTSGRIFFIFSRAESRAYRSTKFTCSVNIRFQDHQRSTGMVYVLRTQDRDSGQSSSIQEQENRAPKTHGISTQVVVKRERKPSLLSSMELSHYADGLRHDCCGQMRFLHQLSVVPRGTSVTDVKFVYMVKLVIWQILFAVHDSTEPFGCNRQCGRHPRGKTPFSPYRYFLFD